MTKADLKTGMVVELRNGDKFLVMLNPDCEDRELISFYGGFMKLNNYDDNLNDNEGDAEYDIIKVYTAETSICRLFESSNGKGLRLTLLWERSEVKEMAIEEIEEQLGYKIKIVGEKNA